MWNNMERKKNEALGRPMLTKKVYMSVFVRTWYMKCELQPSLLPVQLLVPLPLHGLEQMQVQVLVQVPKPLLVPVLV